MLEHRGPAPADRPTPRTAPAEVDPTGPDSFPASDPPSSWWGSTDETVPRHPVEAARRPVPTRPPAGALAPASPGTGPAHPEAPAARPGRPPEPGQHRARDTRGGPHPRAGPPATEPVPVYPVRVTVGGIEVAVPTPPGDVVHD